MFDLHAEKLLQKYEIWDKERKPFDQLACGLDLYYSKSCPTAMACSTSGNLVFTAYSDNSIKVLDSRVDKSILDLEGGHEGAIVQTLLVS